MTIEERNEVLRSRLSMALKQGFVLKVHHYMARDRDTGEMFGYETIIFDHDFAKAIWPKHDWKSRDDGLCGSCGLGFGYVAETGAECYIEHLEQMAAGKERLEYLGANTHDKTD